MSVRASKGHASWQDTHRTVHLWLSPLQGSLSAEHLETTEPMTPTDLIRAREALNLSRRDLASVLSVHP
jgi:DNA-binding transcriptional regulator YiaG